MNPAPRQTSTQVIISHLNKVKRNVVTKKLFQLFEGAALRLANQKAIDCTMDLVDCISDLKPKVTVINALDGDNWSEDGQNLVNAVEASLKELGAPTTDLLEKAKSTDMRNIKKTKMRLDERKARGPVPLLYNMPEKKQTPEKVDLREDLEDFRCSMVKQQLLAYRGIKADIWITRYDRQRRTSKRRSWELAPHGLDLKGEILYYVDFKKNPYIVVLKHFISPQPDASGISDTPECSHECQYKEVEYHSPGTKCPNCECILDVPELVPRPEKRWLRSPRLAEHLESHFSDGTIVNIFSDGNTELTTCTFGGARERWEKTTLIVKLRKLKDEAQSGKGKGKATAIGEPPRSNHGSRSLVQADERKNGGDATTSMGVTLMDDFGADVRERERNEDAGIVDG